MLSLWAMEWIMDQRFIFKDPRADDTDELEQLIKMGLKVYLVNKIVDNLGKEHRHQNSHHDKQDGANGQYS